MLQEMQAILINCKPQDTWPIGRKRLLKQKPASEVFMKVKIMIVSQVLSMFGVNLLPPTSWQKSVQVEMWVGYTGRVVSWNGE